MNSNDQLKRYIISPHVYYSAVDFGRIVGYSCGGGTANEGASTVGAIQVPGTPAGPDPNSWMLACIGSGQNRPFNNNDKTALNYLY